MNEMIRALPGGDSARHRPFTALWAGVVGYRGSEECAAFNADRY